MQSRAESTPQRLASSFLSSLQRVLETSSTEARTLTNALSAPPQSSGTEALSLSKRVCSDARSLQAQQARLVAVANEAPSLSQLLDAMEKALDNRDKVLDQFEKYVHEAYGIEPLPPSKPLSFARGNERESGHGEIVADADSTPCQHLQSHSHKSTSLKPGSSESDLFQVTPPTNMAVPTFAETKEEFMPRTPRLEDFGITNLDLEGIKAPPLQFHKSAQKRRANERLHESRNERKHSGPRRAAEANNYPDSRPIQNVATALYPTSLATESHSSTLENSNNAPQAPTYTAAYEETSPSPPPEEEETIDEMVQKSMAALGIETPQQLSTRFERKMRSYTAATPQTERPVPLRDLPRLHSAALFAEETPRVQTRMSAAQRLALEEYDGLPMFIKTAVDQRALLTACEVVESGGPNRSYTSDEMHALLERGVPGVAIQGITLALVRVRVLSIAKGTDGSTTYTLVA